MKKKYKLALWIIVALVAIELTVLYLQSVDVAVLNPKGLIALKEKNLFIAAIALMLIVVIPVLFMTFYFAWKYRADNPKAKYDPDFDHSMLAETIWWGFPFLIIIFLSVLTWKSSHELDPFKPIEAKAKPMTIQVVALQWKWLFIYPEQNIASVNFVQFPEKVPIAFEITSDAPMNSFWIPQLGGQIYAMPGMKTKLHLIADEAGSYSGSSANLSGKGFAGMRFTAKATSQEEFEAWASLARSSPQGLDQAAYDELSRPSQYNPVAFYVLKDDGLFERIVMQYMTPR